MTITYLKRSKSETDKRADDESVKSQVEKILRDIELHGDAAVREMSEKFDKYSPPSFRLSPSEIEALINRVTRHDMEDIKFAQAQVRRFAEAQRASMTDIEIETMPGVILGHRNLPSAVCRLLCAWREVPDGGLGPYVGTDSNCGGSSAHCCGHTTVQR